MLLIAYIIVFSPKYPWRPPHVYITSKNVALQVVEASVSKQLNVEDPDISDAYLAAITNNRMFRYMIELNLISRPRQRLFRSGKL